jgi:hypothetical protein
MSLDITLIENCEVVLDINITHNLNKMAQEAGIYHLVWRPEEIGITHASQIEVPLTEGILKMIKNPTHFRTFDSPNGWGKYDHFLPFLAEYLESCIKHPNASIVISR